MLSCQSTLPSVPVFLCERTRPSYLANLVPRLAMRCAGKVQAADSLLLAGGFCFLTPPWGDDPPPPPCPTGPGSARGPQASVNPCGMGILGAGTKVPPGYSCSRVPDRTKRDLLCDPTNVDDICVLAAARPAMAILGPCPVSSARRIYATPQRTRKTSW